jgi:hypothetical protein
MVPSVYRGLEHWPLVPAAMNDALEWVATRFAGQPAASNCGQPGTGG